MGHIGALRQFQGVVLLGLPRMQGHAPIPWYARRALICARCCWRKLSLFGSSHVQVEAGPGGRSEAPTVPPATGKEGGTSCTRAAKIQLPSCSCSQLPSDVWAVTCTAVSATYTRCTGYCKPGPSRTFEATVVRGWRSTVSGSWARLWPLRSSHRHRSSTETLH